MKTLFTISFVLSASSAFGAKGNSVSCEIDKKPYEGYLIAPSPNASFPKTPRSLHDAFIALA